MRLPLRTVSPSAPGCRKPLSDASGSETGSRAWPSGRRRLARSRPRNVRPVKHFSTDSLTSRNGARRVTARALTYDTGALVAAERGNRVVWSLHPAALNRGLPLVVPAGVLAEGWQGGPQAALSRLLKGCLVEDLSKAQARAIGSLAAFWTRRRRRRIRRRGCHPPTACRRDLESNTSA
jgi:hypothetical protein